MSTQTFDETQHRRATDGSFTEKEHTAPEAALPTVEAGADEPFTDGIQQELFPADWTADDFPSAEGDDAEQVEAIDEYFSQPEPDLDALAAAADVNLFDESTWPAAAPF